MQEEKLLASGKGIGVYISLVEPVLFLRGFEGQTEPGQNAVVLRGVLHLHVTKPTKIRAVTLALQGKAVTTWPEGDYPTFPAHARTLKQRQAFHLGKSNLKNRGPSSAMRGRSFIPRPKQYRL